MKTTLCWLLTIALLATGCTAHPTKPANTLIYGRASDANTLDPVNTDIGEAVKVIINLYDTLVAYDDETLDLVPALATSWNHSEDGLIWTFQLREGVKFHDGATVDAAAVAYSFARLLDDKHPDVYDQARPYQPSYKTIKSVVAKDPHTVVFTLSEPSAVFLNNVAMFPASIVSPTAVKKLGKEFATNPVGAGPFRFERWRRDQQIVLQPHREYWNGSPKLDRLVFVPISDSVTRVQQLKQGGIQLAEDLPPAELDAVAKLPGIVIQETAGLNVGYLTMQMEKPPLTLLKVRRAIAHAIDKQDLVRVVYTNHARPAVNMVPPTMWGHHDQLRDREYNPELAKQLVTEAAAEAKFELPLKLRLAVMNQARPYMQQPLETASFIKDALSKIGIEVNVEPRPTSQHFPHLMAGQHELGLAGWTTDNSDPDNFLYPMLDIDNISEAGNNLSRYRSDELHKLLLAGQRELDEQKRIEIYHRAQEVVFEDVPVVPLVHCQIRIAQRSEVKGYKLHPTILPHLRRAFIEASP